MSTNHLTRADHRGGSAVLRGKLDILVYYEDTDFSGFVYHANYLKFFERAREHLIGIRFLQDLFGLGIHFVVRRADVSFLRPAKHADALVIETSCRFSRSPRLHFSQRVLRPLPGAAMEELVVAEIEAAVLKGDRPIRLPQEVWARFIQMSGIGLVDEGEVLP